MYGAERIGAGSGGFPDLVHVGSSLFRRETAEICSQQFQKFPVFFPKLLDSLKIFRAGDVKAPFQSLCSVQQAQNGVQVGEWHMVLQDRFQ